MYRRDTIVDSSPMGPSQAYGYRAALDESDDELADVNITQPTLPVRSSYFAQAPRHTPPPSQFVTQPTQILSTTPKSNIVNNGSQVQVVRSSPINDRHSSPASRPFVSAIAPPGTFIRRPVPAPRPIPIDLTSDDPPAENDSGEEETLRSNIRPSVFESGKSRTFRVEETPQKRSFDMSGFMYNSNRKRPANEVAASTPPKDKKPRPVPRQTGPSRAMPVAPVLDLNEIPDYDMRNKIVRLQAVVIGRSTRDLYNALIAKRGNYSDALDYLTAESNNDTPIEISDDELLATPPKLQPVKTAMRELKVPQKSIHEKFSAFGPSQPTNLDSSPPVKRKGRFVRGRRNPSPAPSSSPPQIIAERPKPRKVESDDEDEGIGSISDSDSEAEALEVEVVDDGSLLNFFNTCSVDAMVDLSNQKEDVVRAVLAHRPFRSLQDVEQVSLDPKPSGNKKARKAKVSVGEKLVEFASNMWSGYQAIDQLVTQCKELGKPITAAMAKWGVDVFGAATDGEIALTSLDDNSDTNSIRDSGIGTPRSGSDTEADSVAKVPRSKTLFLKKPSNMNADIELKDYQLVGLNWLNLLWQHGMSCILADDMGLGKTCQVIAFLSHLQDRNVPGPHLIIVPGSTLENWLREFQHFSDKLVVEPYYGLQASRDEQQVRILDNIKSIDVIVTTYDLAYKKGDSSFLRKCKPQVCVFDEGHVLRSSNTQRYKSLMRIPAKFRLLLTGTPLQNNLRELASILAFIMPDIFQDLEEDLAFVFKHKAKTTDSDTHGALLSTQRIQRARSMMAPFVLRRKKAQVLKHLPKKTCRVEYCELTETQSKLYSEQLEKQRKVLLERAAGLQPKEQTNIMMKLRQAAIHPLLFRSHYGNDMIRKMSKACLKEPTFKDSDSDVIYEELQLYQDYQCHQLATKYPKALGKYMLAKEEWMDSGKVKKLAELLKKFKANGDRALVFSQFTSVMDILQWVLDTLDISYFRLDGQTPIAQRQDMLDQFYEDETIPVFMLSTKSGGAGINLACANKVIIFDSSFNPQDDIQAENRAHRVGQTREVEVIRLVTKGTVEEQIHALGVSKLELDKLVAGEESESNNKKASADKLSAAEEMGLEAVEKMLMEQMKREKEGDNDKKKTDLKDQFLDKLKGAGLDMSAA
ncbi:hypothetical protein K469DRAFT_685687 [Zopfia rhizophila CBS 207.26]|uniref:DNA helicase n=1 Tax=Zopfia rhizophila CBS 207.26 TaxID=1314779 RepID=A0A6A6EAJ8_9PEZI|nr:hypothetical protein K469DRAFT_685687 [Zopfia rhizophila CBS 207.26]